MSSSTISYPPGGGGGGSGTVTNVSSADANATVATGTTTPVITIVTAPNLSGTPTVPNGTAAATQAAGDNSTKLSTTAFVTTAVNNAIAGVNPAVAVQAATAAVLPNSPTYSNGVSGIGATLTTATTNTALVVDGYTPALNGRILVKNQASAFQNGVYFLSTLAALGVAWVLTRALDYNQPSDMNNTGSIPVINGTVNIDTSWVQTSQVTTVGTDAVTFTQFTLNPTTLMTTTTYDAANIAQQVIGTTATQTLTNKRITKRVLALSANSATPAINTDSYDVVHITSQTTAITSFTTNLTGTPVDGDTLRISITGTASVALTWGASFESSTATLPTTTSSTTRLDVGFFWNTESSKWRCMAVA